MFTYVHKHIHLYFYIHPDTHTYTVIAVRDIKGTVGISDPIYLLFLFYICTELPKLVFFSLLSFTSFLSFLLFAFFLFAISTNIVCRMNLS